VADLWATLASQARTFSPVEVVAVLSAIAYLFLAIRQNIWCWLGAAISTAIYVYLFFVARLYMESVLNAFYFAMAIYGWHVWYTGRSGDQELPVSVWPLRVHAVAILTIVVASLANGYALARFTDAAYPYIDSLTTWGAIWATFLVARKVLENWWYWLVIDIASIAIYWARDLQLTSLLFVVYVLMIPFGIRAWRRSWREHMA
jgi:nicotinamide mononucleotide transporter